MLEIIPLPYQPKIFFKKAVSLLELYSARPPELFGLTYIQFYEEYMVVRENLATTRVATFWNISMRGNIFMVYRKTIGESVAIIYMLYPNKSKVYYLRLILLSTSPTSFTDAKTVSGVLQSTYHEAAIHLGLLSAEN
ncbi:hypothetical protein BB559_007301 [Furculomyces boomerangus]|uniref:Uncharacterized protein n=1 Tax=Furculomyces boomerangus TaxID=61424 RepID=A0A2T9XXX1_9FUNG|nr:hypothetical protein BB559_007301 [Furculomyces boomerangus]